VEEIDAGRGTFLTFDGVGEPGGTATVDYLRALDVGGSRD